jgi:DnaK suppressor protein
LCDGAYGVCEGCGAEIGEERLTILPFATRCVECKQQEETAEKRVEPTGRGFRAGFRDLRDIDEDLEPDDE